MVNANVLIDAQIHFIKDLSKLTTKFKGQVCKKAAYKAAHKPLKITRNCKQQLLTERREPKLKKSHQKSQRSLMSLLNCD